MKKIKEFFKKYWREIISWIVGLVGIFLVIVVAPFGFGFSAKPDVRMEREVVILASVVLVLYLLKKNK